MDFEPKTVLFLKDIENMAFANGETGKTYDCADPDEYFDSFGFFHTQSGRVCPAPLCGIKYYTTWNWDYGKCKIISNS